MLEVVLRILGFVSICYVAMWFLGTVFASKEKR
jgi:hypothetical protein